MRSLTTIYWMNIRYYMNTENDMNRDENKTIECKKDMKKDRRLKSSRDIAEWFHLNGKEYMCRVAVHTVCKRIKECAASAEGYNANDEQRYFCPRQYSSSFIEMVQRRQYSERLNKLKSRMVFFFRIYFFFFFLKHHRAVFVNNAIEEENNRMSMLNTITTRLRATRYWRWHCEYPKTVRSDTF